MSLSVFFFVIIILVCLWVWSNRIRMLLLNVNICRVWYVIMIMLVWFLCVFKMEVNFFIKFNLIKDCLFVLCLMYVFFMNRRVSFKILGFDEWSFSNFRKSFFFLLFNKLGCLFVSEIMDNKVCFRRERLFLYFFIVWRRVL